jgi:nucleotidyltransferase AbiEii toxin of type IV toxin-antitoxin system
MPMTWYPEILARRQAKVLAKIGPTLSKRGFYLAGGTAVALQLGHRRSVDFDWFTLEGLDEPLREAETLHSHEIPFKIDQVAPGTLHGTVGGVRVSLLRYRYPLLKRLRTWPGNIRIACRADLAAMKLSAVAQRGAKKDFVDIYALGQRSASLRQMLRCHQQKFTTTDQAHLLYSLAYFEDADKERMPQMLWDVTWQAVKATIRRWLQAISARS